MADQPPPSNPDSSPSAGGVPTLRCFTNCQLCISGELIPQDLYFSPETGLITPNYYYRTDGVARIDLGGAIVAPGFLDLQTNGMGGFHFTQLGGEGRTREEDERELAKIARREVEVGVTGWWATVPTVERGRWREVGDFGFSLFILFFLSDPLLFTFSGWISSRVSPCQVLNVGALTEVKKTPAVLLSNCSEQLLRSLHIYHHLFHPFPPLRTQPHQPTAN